ncbi:hypothetical protein D3C72_940760 [compost metagenome]
MYLQLGQRDDRVLHVLGGAQHGPAIVRQGLGVGAFGLRNFGVHPAEIEQSPAQPRDGGGLECGRGKQLAGGQALETKQGGDRHLGVVLRRGDADLGARCRQAALSRHHVRATLQQVGRPLRHGDLRHGHALGGHRQFCAVGAGLRAHQHVEAVELGFQFDLQRWEGDAGLCELRFCLSPFALGADAIGQAQLHQFQQPGIGAHLLLCNGDALLRAAHAEVGIGGFRHHQHAHAQVLGFGGLGFRARRLGAPTQAAGHVDFPACPHARAVQRLVAVIARQVSAEPALRSFQRLALFAHAGGERPLRQQLGAGPARGGAGLIHTGDGSREIQVLLQRALDDPCQRGIVEAEPPTIQ